MKYFSLKIVGKYCLLSALSLSVGHTSSDMIDLYMMGVLPAIISSNSEPVITPVVSDDPVVNMASYHSTSVNLIHALKRYRDGNFELSSIASNNFTQSIDSYDMTPAELKLFSEKLIDNLPRMAAVSLYIHYLNGLQVKIPAGMVHTAQPAIQPRIAFTTVALIAGLVFGAQQAAVHTHEAIEDYNKVGAATIAKAKGEELEHINTDVLGLNKNATAQEALAKYKSMGFMKKAELTTHGISDANSKYGDDQTIPKSRTGFANLATKVTKEGVILTVGTEVSLIGGQGVDKLATAAGLSANVAAGIDLAITVAGKQPLDYVVAATESKEKTNQTIPSSTMDLTEAVTTLEQLARYREIKIEDLIEASIKIANETAQLIPEAKILADGSVEVPVSDIMDLRLIEKLEDRDTLKIRDIDEFDVLVLMDDKYPEKHTDLESEGLESLALDSVEMPECPIKMDDYYQGEQSGNYKQCSYDLSHNLTGEARYENDLLSLFMRFWSGESGILVSVRSYSFGVPISKKSYYKSGDLWGVVPLDSSGRKNGVEYSFEDGTGRLTYKIEFTAGKKNGQEIRYSYDPDSQWCYEWEHDNFIGYCN